jgi:hypothetical protein
LRFPALSLRWENTLRPHRTQNRTRSCCLTLLITCVYESVVASNQHHLHLPGRQSIDLSNGRQTESIQICVLQWTRRVEEGKHGFPFLKHRFNLAGCSHVKSQAGEVNCTSGALRCALRIVQST